MPLLLSLLVSSQDYKLDRSRSRTSSIIQSGSIHLSVKEPYQHEEYGEVHKVKLDVKVTVAYSRKHETSHFHLPVDYFTKAFWQELKEVDYLDLPDFYIKHVKTINDQCNEVLIYNFKRNQGNLINDQAEIRSVVCTGGAGIGARTLDMKGSVNGFDYKAGFDAVR